MAIQELGMIPMGGGPIPPHSMIGFSQFKPHHRTMATSTFPELLGACTDPDNGTIRWSTACQAAQDHNLWAEFCAAYGTVPFRVDTGELLTWLGY